MDFIKWHSIENTYRTKKIKYWLNLFPELASEQFVLTEKIHGSNLQIAVDGNNVRFGSRNGWTDNNFQGAYIPDAVGNVLNILIDYSVYTGNEVRLFGELFGDGIQKGVMYGKEKRFLAFGIMLNNERQPFPVLQDIIPEEYIVPVVAVVNNLNEALNYNTEFDSTILGIENNISEGIVITPLFDAYLDRNGSPFSLKKKNNQFSEKTHSPKEVKISEGVYELSTEFRKYINHNRIQSVFSKYGTITAPSEIGKYIKLVLEDAMDEFIKDFGDEYNDMDKPEQKTVTNIGSSLANMLKEYM